ncbi:hypothetical protein DFH07DRAFT_1065601 [Mycena maculata]|uniref:C3H1-type domain-containing protein n=1 Tax=Mycena maculata TaxID=230809 RepID=A0AAD7I1A2_9AGAR|nr:hypothetical protein DFH07DRAFT_1065601 [Mycena maculata]
MSASSSPADPENADPVIVVLTADTATLAEHKERALAERATKRQEIAGIRHALSKERQAFGVTLMKIKNYQGAVMCFTDACNNWRSNPVCHCDLATAYLHLGRFEEAEAAASMALALDPKLVEARYARAMARKGRGLVRGAIIDLETILKLSEENEAAQTALRELRAISLDEEADPEAEAEAEGATVDVDYETPSLEAEKLEVDSGSDTSDAKHTGNAVPCLFYNHQGCARGNSCQFSHAPDEKSVRDDLGKNVCLYFLLGACKFEAKCIYSHDRTYLSPTRGWWNDEARIAEVRDRIEAVKIKSRAQREQRAMEALMRKLDPEKKKAKAKKGKGKNRGRQQQQQQQQWMGSPPFVVQPWAQLEREMEQRMASLSMGFSYAALNDGFTDYSLNGNGPRAPGQGPDADYAALYNGD